MKIITLSCPKCGGYLENVSIEDGKNDTWCGFCGSHIVIQDTQTQTIIHKNIDEVTVREQEYEKQLIEIGPVHNYVDDIKMEELEKASFRFCFFGISLLVLMVLSQLLYWISGSIDIYTMRDLLSDWSENLSNLGCFALIATIWYFFKMGYIKT